MNKNKFSYVLKSQSCDGLHVHRPGPCTMTCVPLKAYTRSSRLVLHAFPWVDRLPVKWQNPVLSVSVGGLTEKCFSSLAEMLSRRVPWSCKQHGTKLPNTTSIMNAYNRLHVWHLTISLQSRTYQNKVLNKTCCMENFLLRSWFCHLPSPGVFIWR